MNKRIRKKKISGTKRRRARDMRRAIKYCKFVADAIHNMLTPVSRKWFTLTPKSTLPDPKKYYFDIGNGSNLLADLPYTSVDQETYGRSKPNE
jgi:hypothetical protein